MNLLASIGVKNVKMYKALGFDVSTTAKLHICEILILQLFLDNLCPRLPWSYTYTSIL